MVDSGELFNEDCSDSSSYSFCSDVTIDVTSRAVSALSTSSGESSI